MNSVSELYSNSPHSKPFYPLRFAAKPEAGLARRRKKPSYLSSGSPAVLCSHLGPAAFRPPIARCSAFADQGDNPYTVTAL